MWSRLRVVSETFVAHLNICLVPRFAFGRILMDSSLPQKTLDTFFKSDLRIPVGLEFLMGRFHQCYRMTSAWSAPFPTFDLAN